MEKTADKKREFRYWFHVAVGMAFMFLFPLLPPFEPVTPVGMTIMGVFIGMVYLWSTIDSIWPSLLGLLLIALSGYLGDVAGYAAVKQVMLQAFGSDTMMVLMFGMILFGGVEYVGCTKYFTRFFLTRKIINGRPYMFMFMVFLCSYVLSGLTTPIASLLILWPICADIMGSFGLKKGDKAFYIFIVGVYLAATLGQPMFPFKGAALVIVSAFEKLSGETVNYVAYILYNWIMSIILILCYLLLIKFAIRPDMTPIKNVSIEQFKKEKLEPMNLTQKCFMGMIVVYITLLLIPCLMPKSLGFVAALDRIGVIGVSIICIVVLMIVKDKGENVLDFRGVAKRSFNWNTFCIVAAAIYAANAVSNDVTGIKPFLLQLLQPLLGGKPELVFLFLLLAFALITTNFANNAGMAVVLLPIVMTFADQYPGVDPVVICMSITMMVFVAILTPAASPFAGMLHGLKNMVTTKEIISIGLPMCIIALLVYTLIGFPIAKFLF